MTTVLDLGNAFRTEWAADITRACWQGGLAILIAWALGALVPRMSPAVRSWIWRLAYVKLLASLVAWPAVEIPVSPSDD